MNKKIVFTAFYKSIENNIGFEDGGTKYGNMLLYPLVMLCDNLKKIGYSIYSSKQLDIHKADIVVFIDIDEEMVDLFNGLKPEIIKILLCVESPIYAPLSHKAMLLADIRWNAVLTWNRSFKSKNIYYYDIPITGVSALDDTGQYSNDIKDKGIAVSSFKNDVSGNTWFRDRLFKELAASGYIDLYGNHWGKNLKKGIYGSTDHKLNTLKAYKYSLIIENSYYPGYVTEKLGDSILAGIPAIYAGDIDKANERFPGTFIPLKEITMESFLAAEKELRDRYDELCINVVSQREKSDLWSDSFINQFFNVIENISER